MTSAQESILEQIIEAFQNGKSLNDLPLASDVDPYTLLFEVYTEGQSKKASLSSILPYLRSVISEVVSELPQASEQTTGKIYLVPSNAANLCNAFITELESETYVWKQIGQKSIIYGYLNNGTFYLTKSGETYSSPVTPAENTQYTDKDSNVPYIWNGSAFVAIGGESAEIIYGYMHNGTFYLTRTGSAGSYVYSDAVTPETDMQYTDKEGNVPYIWSGSAYTAIGGMQGAVRYDQVQSLSGEEQARALANLGLTFEDIMSYGIEFDTAVSSPTCTRIGNTDLHRSLPIHSLMKGCLLNDSGQVVEYLPETDWTGSTRDGSQGQVMVEIPAHYRKFETQGTKRRVRISQTALPGYHIVPKQYVSAYQATVQRSVNKLASVVNNTADYRGGSNTSAWDELAKSLLGRPASSISRTNFRAYARNRGAAGKNNCGWNCMTYDIQKELYWLYVIEYATLNSQAAYNAQLTVDGYHQGGLGDGVSTWDSSSWNNFNGYNPFVPCGHTDSLGNRTGVVQYDVKNDEQTVIKSFSVPRYRGVENPFAHIWQWTDGINVQIRPASDSEPLSKVYIASDPAVFNDSNYDGYTYVGNEARTDGYVKTLIFGDGGEIMPDTVGGGSTTYFCDYHYTNILSAVTLRGVYFGGSAYRGAGVGFVSAYSLYAPSFTSANVGSRLCFIPA